MYQKSIGNLPIEKVDAGIYRHGTYSPTGYIRKKSMLEHEFVCTPVNGQGNYLAQARGTGAGVSHSNGVFTIVPVESGGLKSLTNRYDLGVGAANDREHHTGTVVTQYTETIDFDNDPELQAVYGQLGRRRQDPGFDANNTPVFPSSQQKPYYADANTILTWDGDDILPYASSFTWSHFNVFQIKYIDGQLYINTKYKKNHIQTWNLVLKRGGTTAKNMWTDYKDWYTNGTTRNLRFKIFNDYDNDLYKDYTFQNCVFLGFDKNHVVSTAQEEPVYTMLGGVTTMTTDIKDGLATSFYGV